MDAAWSAAEIATAVNERRVSAEQVCVGALERAGVRGADCNAFISLMTDRALIRAREVDAKVRSDVTPLPLAGVPIAIKDNIATLFGTTTAGSRVLSVYRAPYDATVIERLEQAGVIIIGKTNLDEFAMGSSNEHSAYGSVANPWNPDCVSGGSSGGSAAVVATGVVPVALGSDTGGSIRLPAAFCGVAGLRPTYGRVSRYGLIAFASSLDQIGPLARSVCDVALILSAIAGHDPRDATSADEVVPDYAETLNDDHVATRLRTLKIGLPAEYFNEVLDQEVRSALNAAIEIYRELGVEITTVSLPHTKYALATYYLIATAEASANLARYDGVHFGSRADGARDFPELNAATRTEFLGAEVKRRIMLGTFVLSAGYHERYYDKACGVRGLIQNDFSSAFANCDILLAPTSPTSAFRLGERADDPLQMYGSDVHTVAASLAGLPAISIPCGQTQAGLPIGMQLIGRPFAETVLLQAARAYERATRWYQMQPGDQS